MPKPSFMPAYEVARRVVQSDGAFVAWIGAGVSLEAGIMAGEAICKDIKSQLTPKVDDPEKWARENLAWDEPNKRYSKCLSRLGTSAQRVNYFRKVIRDAQPSFSHHAIALLMRRGRLRQSCLTTNFDKLIEMAFAQQAISEYQAIRSDEERQYWRYDDDKNYVIKLHGDYDTGNILNTDEEVIRIPKSLREISTQLLRGNGLVVLGSSGYEASLITYFDDLWSDGDHSVLELGLYWGVYMGEDRPSEMTPDQEEEQLYAAIADGRVSSEIVGNSFRAKNSRREFSFFPVWGSSQFLFELMEDVHDAELAAEGRRYLDHKMRIREILRRGGLEPKAIAARLDALDRRERAARKQTISAVPQTTLALNGRAADTGDQVSVVYGDLSDSSLLSIDSGPGLRAVISPDDNLLSAGGGAALALLDKAGKTQLLSEMGKFPTVRQRDVLVTSGFKLPVNYIFHAATLRLNPDGSSNITVEDVQATMSNALRAANALSIGVLFAPLLGSGMAAVPTDKSLTALLTAYADFISVKPRVPLSLVIVILHEADLSRKEAREILGKALPGFTLTAMPPGTVMLS